MIRNTLETNFLLNKLFYGNEEYTEEMTEALIHLDYVDDVLSATK